MNDMSGSRIFGFILDGIIALGLLILMACRLITPGEGLPILSLMAGTHLGRRWGRGEKEAETRQLERNNNHLLS